MDEFGKEEEEDDGGVEGAVAADVFPYPADVVPTVDPACAPLSTSPALPSLPPLSTSKNASGTRGRKDRSCSLRGSNVCRSSDFTYRSRAARRVSRNSAFILPIAFFGGIFPMFTNGKCFLKCVSSAKKSEYRWYTTS